MESSNSLHFIGLEAIQASKCRIQKHDDAKSPFLIRAVGVWARDEASCSRPGYILAAKAPRVGPGALTNLGPPEQGVPSVRWGINNGEAGRCIHAGERDLSGVLRFFKEPHTPPEEGDATPVSLPLTSPLNFC